MESIIGWMQQVYDDATLRDESKLELMEVLETTLVEFLIVYRDYNRPSSWVEAETNMRGAIAMIQYGTSTPAAAKICCDRLQRAIHGWVLSFQERTSPVTAIEQEYIVQHQNDLPPPPPPQQPLQGGGPLKKWIKKYFTKLVPYKPPRVQLV